MSELLTQIIWWTSNALMALLLFRSVRGGFFRKYPAFYVYLSWVLADTLFAFYIYMFHPGAYRVYYWYAEFVSVALGYCVIWEIYNQALADYPGAGRLARTVVSIVFVAVLGKVLAHMLDSSIWSLAETTAVLERNLRLVQAVLLVAIVGVVAYYAIPLGRNLKGMVLGYGFFIGTSVIYLTLRSYIGRDFQVWWQYLLPASYVTSLAIWVAYLWTYQPNPRPKTEIRIERDYELLAAQTARAVARARSTLVRVVRS